MGLESDGDGALDIYICNYRTTTLRDMPSTNFRINMIDGKPVVAAVNGEPTSLPQYEGRFALNSSGSFTPSPSTRNGRGPRRAASSA